MLSFVLFGNIILAFMDSIIMSVGSDIIVTLALVNVKYSKYFLPLRILCVVALFIRHKSPSWKVMPLFKI